MRVMKFGGSCLKDARDLERMVATLRAEPLPAVAVLSALAGVTDLLIAACENARVGRTELGCADGAEVASIHRDLVAHLPREVRETVRGRAEALIGELQSILAGVRVLRELSPRTRDLILSFGERLAVEVAAGHLAAAGLPVEALTGWEAGILTDSRFGDANPLPSSRDAVRARLAAPRLYLVTGFIARDAAGEVTTLGRGGSDTTTTFIAASLGCPAVLWKDVPGFSTADPKVVPAARIIAEMHYLDALELAHYGSRIIHEKALHPARESGTPIEIRGFGGDDRRTTISGREARCIAVTCVPEVADVEIVGISDEILPTLSRLFAACAEGRVYPLLFTEASPAGETSLVVRASELSALGDFLAGLAGKVEVDIRRDLGVVSIIGSGMTGRVGFAASVFETLAAEGINIVAIAQTASERNVSCLVARDAAPRAVRALHRRFVEEA